METVDPGTGEERDENDHALVTPANRSVLTDYLEREVPTNTVYDYGEPTQSFELVWRRESFSDWVCQRQRLPGFKLKGCKPLRPGLDFYRFLQGAQGTFGIVTWMNLKIEFATKMDKSSVHRSKIWRWLRISVQGAPEENRQEVVLLNNVDLAAILADDFGASFDKLRATLPPWSLIMIISGLMRRPEEKIAYEEKLLDQVMKNEFQKIKLVDTIPGFPV